MSKSTEYLTYSNTPSHTTTTDLQNWITTTHNGSSAKQIITTSGNTTITDSLISYSADKYLDGIRTSIKSVNSEEELIKLMSELDRLKKEMEGCLERIQDTKIKRRKLKL
tara:strand:- start:1997 stop:2326 length:330 start_codon:yes stop_codon:yes gene_type:complete